MRTWKIGNWLVCAAALCPLNVFVHSMLARAVIMSISMMFTLCAWAILCDYVPHGNPRDLATIKREGWALYRIIGCSGVGFLSVILRWTPLGVAAVVLVWIWFRMKHTQQIRRKRTMRNPFYRNETHEETDSCQDGKTRLEGVITVSRTMEHVVLTPEQLSIAHKHIINEHLLFPGATFAINTLEQDRILLEATWQVFDGRWSWRLIRAKAKEINSRMTKLQKFAEDAENQIRFLLTIRDFVAAGRRK